MVDELTIAALGLSTVTFALVLFIAYRLSTRPTSSGTDAANLESTFNEMKGMVSTLSGPISQMLTAVGKIEQATAQTSSEMLEVKKVTDLLGGSSQKKGQAGETIVRTYLERLPRELWEEQYSIPGGEGRVDYALRVYSGSKQLLLPIDSKFSLPDATESFEDLANRLARERASEVVKYITPGLTTDFAVMVLPNSVFYALTSETTVAIQEVRVVPCPPEGVIILSNLVMRAHQSVVLAKSAEKLRAYVFEIDVKLSRVRDDIGKLGKNLRGATKNVKLTLDDLDNTRSALSEITTHLDESKPEVAPGSLGMTSLVQGPPAEEDDEPKV